MLPCASADALRASPHALNAPPQASNPSTQPLSAPSQPLSPSSRRHSASDRASALSRRRLLLSAPLVPLLGLALPSLGGRGLGSPAPALAENVRLEDVESRDLQEALEAAISGDLESAEVLFGRLIEQSRDSASMWSNRGSVRLSLGKYEDAVGDFSRAIELAPFAAVPYLNRAIAYEVCPQSPHRPLPSPTSTAPSHTRYARKPPTVRGRP